MINLHMHKLRYPSRKKSKFLNRYDIGKSPLSTYKSTRRYYPGDQHLYHRREILRPHIMLILNSHLPNKLTTCNRVRFENLTMAQLVKKFLAHFCNTNVPYRVHDSSPLDPTLSQMTTDPYPHTKFLLLLYDKF
jgi:hypothetical protein